MIILLVVTFSSGGCKVTASPSLEESVVKETVIGEFTEESKEEASDESEVQESSIELAEELAKELIEKKEAEEHIDNGNALMDEEKYDQAILEFDEAIKLDPDFAISYWCRGIAYSSKKDSNKAISDFTKAIELGLESFAFIYYFRGGEYFKIGQYDKAILDYSKSIELDPNYNGSYLFRSVCYTMIGEFDKANADKDRAEKCDPNYIFHQ